MPTQSEKADRFVALHERDDVFLILNPWDAASARVLGSLGFEALATTSSGFAIQAGEPDGSRAVDRTAVLENCRQICAATDLPANGDLENLYADAPEEAAWTIGLAAQAGLVGCSIEDCSCDPNVGIYDFDLSVERVHAAVEAARALPFRFTLTARAAATGFLTAAREIAEKGTFRYSGGLLGGKDLEVYLKSS
jgi:2-methylisocitrate lyase-like PEP mutase family enzyme